MGNSKLFNKQGKDFRVTSPYGMRDIGQLGMKNNYHIGIDYAYPQGTELVSPVDGEVISVSNWGDYGGQIFVYNKELDHTLHYAHVNRTDVKQGQNIKAGQVLGLSGGALGTNGVGTSTGPHLHIGLTKGRNTSLYKGTMGDGLWVDIDKFNFFPKKDLDLVATEVANGEYGNGQARKDNLKKAGYTNSEITEIQSIVNKIAGVEKPQPKPQPKPQKQTVEFFGDVHLYANSKGNATYPAGTNNTTTNVKRRVKEVLESKDGRVLIEEDKFRPKRVWLQPNDTNIILSGATQEKPKPKPTPPKKNEYNQNVEVGSTIYFSTLYTAVTGGLVYSASATGRDQKLSNEYIKTIDVNGVKTRVYEAKVSKIYPKSKGYQNPYELETKNGKSVLGRTRPTNVYRVK